MREPDPRLCRACGRPLGARAERPGEARVYCSRRCRARRVGPRELRLERAIVTLLEARHPHASICPSEAAREVGGERWRDELEAVRRAGRRLAARGVVEFTQRGRVVDAALARGPVRIRRCAGARADGSH